MAAPASSRRRPRRTDGTTVPVAIFYEDVAAADRALRSVRAALRRQRDHRRVMPLLWQVGRLDAEPWQRFAAADIAAAEVCLVSLGLEAMAAARNAAWFRTLSRPDPNKWVVLAPFAAERTEDSLSRAAG
jgi:hypothetical protein